MNKKTLLLLSAATITFPVTTAGANERYSTPPALTLSPDLTSPWLLQLRNAPTTNRPRFEFVKPEKKFYQQPDSRGYTQKTRNKREATGLFSWFTSRNVPKRLPQAQTSSFAGVQSQQAATASNAAAAGYIQKEAARRTIDPKYLPRTVNYETTHQPGSIIINTQTRYLYLVMDDGKARRYGVGVGKQGFEWNGTEKISLKAEWPSWRPPAEMIKRERKNGVELPVFMEGGPSNPLGARALYLGSTLYRIHGTNQPWTIGQAVSSGCIRMRNEDVMELYERSGIGAKVVVI